MAEVVSALLRLGPGKVLGCGPYVFSVAGCQLSSARLPESSERALFPCRRVVRKSIARVLTVINQTQKENLRKFYKVHPNIL